MKKDSFYFKRIYPILFMLLITIACITITSGLFLLTQERVTANENLFLKKTVLEAAGVEYPDDFVAVNTLFDEIVLERNGVYTVSTDTGDQVYVTEFTGPGLWGPISLMVGFSETLDALTGIGIISQNETPGLGARIEEPEFKAQFVGKWGPFSLVEEGTADADNEIDALTGATRTSRSVQTIMNRAVAEGPQIVRGL
jgi:Na+-transporting NADH:ubiquinone oxidoreductase subunit C